MSPTPPAGPLPPDSTGPSAAAPVRPAIQVAAERLASGQPADAATALARLVAEAPTYAAAHVLLAVALEASGQPAEALAAWHRAAFLVPQSPLVIRERSRLLAASGPGILSPEAPPPGGDVEDARLEAPQDVDDAWEEAEAPGAEDPPPDAFDPEPYATGPTADEASDDIPSLETLPLDDLAVSVPLADEEDGDLDPEGFDFSGFDLGDDDADWLTAHGGDTAPQDAFPEPGEIVSPAVADWSDILDDAAVTIMPPEATEPTPDLASEPDPEPATWAVFEDEPLAADPFADETLATEAFGTEPPVADPFADETPAARTPSVADELDSLIASLEQAPRIRPDPTFSGPELRSADVDVDEMASETLARIYAAQHQYAEAALVYETLAAREPERAEAMLAQAAAMRQRRA